MSCFGDYEVLSIIGTNSNTTCYKVKRKSSSEVFMWKAFNYEQCNRSCDELLKCVEERKKREHAILMEVCDCIHHEESNTIYLITEYCKYGSLYNVIQQSLKNDEYIDENFIWLLLYKLASFLKQAKTAALNTHDIFIDVYTNIKLLDFSIDDTSSTLHDLGSILRTIINPHATEFPNYYSNELQEMLKFLTDENCDVIPTVDSILSHPTVLAKYAQRRSEKCLEIKYPKPKKKGEDFDTSKLNPGEVYHAKLENVRKREAAVKTSEDKLMERKRHLDVREKKIVLLERIVKEKVARAELYLKHAKENKSLGNAQSKENIAKKISYEKIDTSFSADCGDSVVLPTSRKMKIEDIVKPAKFTRAMSERRVRFKNHSPLKEMHSYKRAAVASRQRLQALPKLESDSDRTSESNSERCGAMEKSTGKPKKFLLSAMFSKKAKKPSSVASSSDTASGHTYEDIDREDLRLEETECKPLNWTEGSKKHAFELLRMLNEEASCERSGEVKHTLL